MKGNTMATTTMEDYWHDVKEAVQYAKSISFDGCHKIYLAMDDTQAEWFKANYNGEGCDDRTFVGTPEEMFALLQEWYENSCSLKFIQSVTTNEDDPNEGFESLIPQGAHDEDEDEDEDY
jgi:alkanesulfonate monooxygenase SsuD/methylene tetrahydromethanopterin reductase-like flavin-dependent oxidoreductase (luciferase family)